MISNEPISIILNEMIILLFITYIFLYYLSTKTSKGILKYQDFSVLYSDLLSIFKFVFLLLINIVFYINCSDIFGVKNFWSALFDCITFFFFSIYVINSLTKTILYLFNSKNKLYKIYVKVLTDFQDYELKQIIDCKYDDIISKLKKAQRKLSKKKNGSNNKNKQRLKLEDREWICPSCNISLTI